MKILQIHNEYKFRGGEDSVVRAEEELLKKNGNEVFKAIANNHHLKSFFNERKKFYQILTKIITENRIDIVHIHNVYHIIGNDIYRLIYSMNIPIVQTLHNFRFLCPAGLFMDNSHQICEKCSQGSFINCTLKKCYQNSHFKSLGMSILAKNGKNEVVKYVDRFIVLNEFSKSRFLKYGFNPDRFVVKSNFIEARKFVPTEYNYILYIGRLSPEKGVETLIEAFIQLRMPLKIAGSGDEIYVNKLKVLAEKNKQIEFLGYVEGGIKEELIKKTKFLIIPSLCYENFPVSILDAYSFSKPIIASNIGGIPYIVKNGETGFLFEPGNFLSLKAVVEKMLEKDRFIEMGVNGYKYFSENFTEKQNYEQLMSIYGSAIEERAKKNEKKETH